MKSFPARSAPWLLGLALLASGPRADATIVGLNQIVTPDIQPTGVLSLSAQAQHTLIGNSQQLQLELGLTPRLEVAWFEGLKPTEGLFSAEFNLVHQGPNLVTVGVLNWSTLGGSPQPVVEYGYYTASDNFIIGTIRVDQRNALLAGYKHVITEKLQFSTDFQSGTGGAATVGLTWNITPSLSINPALYRMNSSPHHLLGYVVLTWNFILWK